MRILKEMAHYDSQGMLAPHARRNLAALNEVADRVIVVSTADLTDPEAEQQLREHSELVRRPNYGYDFYSYKIGLDSVTDLGSYDQVIICNDSYVGPLLPYSTIVSRMAARPVDFWGMTFSYGRAPHVQSFFVAFRKWVTNSKAFTGFWRDMTPISERDEVISQYEVGMSGRLMDAGFVPGSYFEEGPEDRRLARMRHLWWCQQRIRQAPRHRRPRALRLVSEPWNPVPALADRALPDPATGEPRLPFVKIDTLRYDPYGLGTERLLSRCEKAYPEQFAGIRDYLRRTESAYPRRADEPLIAPPPTPLRPILGYAS